APRPVWVRDRDHERSHRRRAVEHAPARHAVRRTDYRAERSRCTRRGHKSGGAPYVATVEAEVARAGQTAEIIRTEGTPARLRSRGLPVSQPGCCAIDAGTRTPLSRTRPVGGPALQVRLTHAVSLAETRSRGLGRCRQRHPANVHPQTHGLGP